MLRGCVGAVQVGTDTHGKRVRLHTGPLADGPTGAGRVEGWEAGARGTSQAWRESDHLRSCCFLKSWRQDGASRRCEAADAWDLLITEPRMLRRELIFPRVRRMAGPRVPLGARRAYRAGHPGHMARLVVLQLARCGPRDLVHKYAAGGQVGPGWAVSCATTWPSHGPWPSHRPWPSLQRATSHTGSGVWVQGVPALVQGYDLDMRRSRTARPPRRWP